MSIRDLHNTSKFALPFIAIFAFHTYSNIAMGTENTAAMLLRFAASQQMVLFYWIPMTALFGVLWYFFYYRAAVYYLKNSENLEHNATTEDE